jgi:alpha-beta hydrolase superfamily lysophospholipase
MGDYCKHRKHYEHRGNCYYDGSHRGHGFNRRFISREEKIERLENYLKDLQAEAKAVEEHLANLKAST